MDSYMTYRSENDINNTEGFKEIFEFLQLIKLEDFTFNLVKNGFDDLNLLIEEYKTDAALTDGNLRDIGINLPGERARILIKLEESKLLQIYKSI
jgi:hypothetical protein